MCPIDAHESVVVNLDPSVAATAVGAKVLDFLQSVPVIHEKLEEWAVDQEVIVGGKGIRVSILGTNILVGRVVSVPVLLVHQAILKGSLLLLPLVHSGNKEDMAGIANDGGANAQEIDNTDGLHVQLLKETDFQTFFDWRKTILIGWN